MMGLCLYCGKPTPLFKKYHKECSRRHQDCIAVIPTFFEKYLSSSLSAERFSQLLTDAATSSYVSPTQLTEISSTGVLSLINKVLEDHLPTPAEQERVVELAAALKLPAALPELDDKLLKIEILRDLQSGKSDSDRTAVVGPMPLQLQTDERIVWIFNRAGWEWRKRGENNQNIVFEFEPSSSGRPRYYPLNRAGTALAANGEKRKAGNGDFVITNFNIWLMSGEIIESIQLSRIRKLYPHLDAIELIIDERPGESCLFKLDDPWFATNMVLSLT